MFFWVIFSDFYYLIFKYLNFLTAFMKAVILCAGYGTRLYPLTINAPKALLKIGESYLLDYTINNLKTVDKIDKIYIVTNNKFYNDFLKWNSDERIEIISDGTDNNEERLGGVMDFALALKKINEDIIVLFGDLYFNFSLKKFFDFFQKRKKICIALHDLGDLEKAKRFGVLETKGENIIGFEEKPQNPKSSLINAGAFIFPKDSILDLKKYINSDKNKENIGYMIIDFIKQGKDIKAFVFSEEWYDIGTMEEYERVKEKVKDKK